MGELDAELNRELADLREKGLYRQRCRIDSAQSPRLLVDGRELLSFSSNDYLGLASHPALKEAAIHCVERFGAGTGASRLISGSLAPHEELEQCLAEFKGTPAALTFTTGYATALGTICALVSKGDIIILDRLVHASIVDGARLSGAKIRIFAHNDLEDLDEKLTWAAARTESLPSAGCNRACRILVVTESIFSMDGDRAPLKEIVRLKDHHGAWLMVDEAHATGLIGPNGRGLAAALNLQSSVEVQMGTLSKAIGAAGGFICGSRTLIDWLVNRARSFIFSTAPVPASAAAAMAGLRLIQSPEGTRLREVLGQRAVELQTGIDQLSWPAGGVPPETTREKGLPRAILPLMMGGETKAVQVAAALREAGIFVPAIRYPTVARNQARLRIAITASHLAEDINDLMKALEKIR